MPDANLSVYDYCGGDDDDNGGGGGGGGDHLFKW